MYIEQGELLKAAKLVEEKLLLLNTEVHETLLCLMDIAIKDKRYDDAEYIANVEGKPDILVYKEGALYKVTLFRRAGVHRKLKPETYLLQREADGNLYLNTGFRIDVAYNEETDILSFSPNGDYIRVNTDETANGEKKKEQ